MFGYVFSDLELISQGCKAPKCNPLIMLHPIIYTKVYIQHLYNTQLLYPKFLTFSYMLLVNIIFFSEKLTVTKNLLSDLAGLYEAR